MLTIIRRCGGGPFSSRTGLAPGVRQPLVNGFAAGFAGAYEGLAMLIRSETNGLIDSEAHARAIAVASLPARLPTGVSARDLLGLLLLSCP